MPDELRRSCIKCKYGFGHVSLRNESLAFCEWFGMSGILSMEMPDIISDKLKIGNYKFEISRDHHYINCDGYVEGSYSITK